MTQAICDITTDEVNVDVVVEPQADTMVAVANRAGGMEQVFHDNTLTGNGNSVDLGVNTEIIATKEYVDENKVDAYTKTEIDNKVTVINAEIDANADAIQKTRDDFINADSEIHQILNNHASELTTLRGNQASLGDQVSGIEEKIPGDASATNQLATKADLANIDLDGYVKKSGDTMTGDLTFDIVDDKYKNIVWNPESEVWVDDITVETRKYLVGPKIVSTGFDILQQYPTYQDASVVLGGVSVESDRFYPARSDGVMKLGLPNRRWDNVYTTNINNGNDLIVPTEGGTLARIEDLIDLRADINEADSELQTQITAQAAEIASKQDQLTAGDNIIISGNVISATGAGGGAGFDVIVVQELPATGQKGIIYLLAKDGTAPDVYDEYVWITATQTFELIGSTKVDLSNYLPLSGGTLTGPITFDLPFGSTFLKFGSSVTAEIKTNAQGYLQLPAFTKVYSRLDVDGNIGGPWNSVTTAYIRQLSRGGNNDAKLIVPDAAGTLARLEDLEGLGGLPDQTDNAGKFLTTDGTTASWSDKPLVNQSGDIYSIAVGAGTVSATNNSIAIGWNATCVGGVALGSGCLTRANAVAVGTDCKVGNSGGGLALGYQAVANGEASAQICLKTGYGYTNNDANTVKIANANGNFEIMSADGTIPAERIGNLDFGTMD